MLNENKQRELAYVVTIDAIEEIVGSDNCEAAVVGGWKIMTRKGTFQKGDLAIYFEIDSKVPETKEFEFLAKKHYKVKTQKYTFGGKGNFISQGLLMHPSDFGWTVEEHNYGKSIHSDKNEFNPNNNSRWLTKELGVVYSVMEDNKRKGNASVDKYKKMYQRHYKLFSKYKVLQWLYSKKLGKKLLFLFLGKKRDTFNWPDWVRKTDEERVQNLPQLFPGDDSMWIVTEKIDGTSTTFTMKRGRRNEFYVCSRNVCFDKPEKEDRCYYDTNVYTEMAGKYDMENVLADLLAKNPDWTFVTIQGETYGEGVQKRTYGIEGHDFMAFNLVYGTKENSYVRMNTVEMSILLEQYKVPSVPILDIEFYIPETMEEMISYADGISRIDGEMREGVVIRSYDGESSFKSVSNDFLLKFHS